MNRYTPLLLLLAACCSSAVVAQDAARTNDATAIAGGITENELLASGIVGTLSVEALDLRSAGSLFGCSLVYKSVFSDAVYQNGRLNVAVGNITFTADTNAPGLSLKIGVRPLLEPDAKFERPNFAYFNTSVASTAKTKQSAVDGDDGFKLFVYSLEDPVTQRVIKSLIDEDILTIAFNRNPNGMDQQFEVDLRVDDINVQGSEFKRKTSSRAKTSFVSCMASLLENLDTKK